MLSQAAWTCMASRLIRMRLHFVQCCLSLGHHVIEEVSMYALYPLPAYLLACPARAVHETQLPYRLPCLPFQAFAHADPPDHVDEYAANNPEQSKPVFSLEYQPNIREIAIHRARSGVVVAGIVELYVQLARWVFVLAQQPPGVDVPIHLWIIPPVPAR